MKVHLTDSIISVEDWRDNLTFLGTYKKKDRKTPEEMKEEKERRLRQNPGKKIRVNPTKMVVMHEISVRDGTAYFMPGLWPRIKAYLDTHQIPYELDDKRYMEIRPKPDYSKLGGVELRYGQDVTLALIAQKDCGIIHCTTAYGKSFLIGCICRMFPTLNILVTAKSAQVVGTLYDYLCKTNPGEVGYIYARGNTSHGKRIVVTTFKSIVHVPTTSVHLLLCDECHEVGASQYGKDISKFMFCRKFGFTASPIRNDNTYMAMEALFGPIIQTVTYQEAVQNKMVTPIKFAFLDTNAAPWSVSGKRRIPDYLMKRYSYWCNNYRNKAIADFVYDLKKAYNGQILIMVETLEHAIQLNMRLPWFSVVHYGGSDQEKLRSKFPIDRYPKLDLSKYKQTPKDLDRMRCAFEKGTLKYVIATTTWKQGKIMLSCAGMRSIKHF